MPVRKQDILKEFDRRGQPAFLGMPAKFHDRCLRVAGTVGGDILDIGCGHGVLLERISRRPQPLRTYGCDVSSVMCARTRARVPTAAIVQADAEDLPFSDDSFDHVFMVEVLEHLQEARKALGEVRRVLWPKGKFPVAVPNRDWFHYPRHMRTRPKHQRIDEQWHWYRAAEIRTLLTACGFTPLKVRGGENLYFGGGIPRGLEKLVLLVAPRLHEKSKRLIVLSVNEKGDGSRAGSPGAG